MKKENITFNTDDYQVKQFFYLIKSFISWTMELVKSSNDMLIDSYTDFECRASYQKCLSQNYLFYKQS